MAANQEVIDAINATIAPNNIKGITAESLNNVLTMMAENAGEGGSGSGSGVVRVWVQELAGLENTADQISENKETFNALFGSGSPQLLMMCASGTLGGFPIMIAENVKVYRLINDEARMVSIGLQQIVSGDNGIEIMESTIYLMEDGSVTIEQ